MATRVIVTGRNATVSNQGGYWIIDNTSGTTIANNVSGSFNSGATSYTFPSKILDNRVLVGYQDNGSSNNGVSYVLDLSTETLKSIAGIAKEAGVESNVIDVVTQGECDFLSGLTPGSYYYSSGTGFLSASVGDYEVGVAKSATNLVMLERITKVNLELMNYIDTIYATKTSPNLINALRFNIWKTREVKTSSGTFTVPAGVYYLMIICAGGGGNGVHATNGAAGGGGGGMSISYLKVLPGQQITYTISSGVSSCLLMQANKGANGSGFSGGSGGTANGGDYNYTGGNGGNVNNVTNASAGGGGCGGGSGGNATIGYAAGGGGGRCFTQYTPGAGGNASVGTYNASGGSPRFNGTNGSYWSSGASLGFAGYAETDSSTPQNEGSMQCPVGIDPFELSNLGCAILSDCYQAQAAWDGSPSYNSSVAYVRYAYKLPFGHAYVYNTTDLPVGAFGGGGPSAQSRGYTGIGGGSGGRSGGGTCGSGMFAGAGGSSSSANPNIPGYGGGAGGFWSTTQSGGSAVVVFIY
jgi:hypothetical protein